MSKLWQKDYDLNKEIEKFTVGSDYIVDRELFDVDIIGSIAHAKMLGKIDVLSPDEVTRLHKTLLGMRAPRRGGPRAQPRPDRDEESSSE